MSQAGLSEAEWNVLVDMHYIERGQSGSGSAAGYRLWTSLLRRGLIGPRELGSTEVVLTPKGRAAVGYYLASKNGGGSTVDLTPAEAQRSTPSPPDPALPPPDLCDEMRQREPTADPDSVYAHNTQPGNRPFD